MIVFVLGLAVTNAQAGIITQLNSCGTLADVIANGCTIGDKLFTRVTFSVGTDSTGAFATSNVLVTGISDSDFQNDFGFRLTGVNGLPLVGAGATLVATLGYTVSVLDPLAFLITDLHLGINSTGNLAGTVTETATNLNTNAVVGVLQGCVNPNPAVCAALNLTDTSSILFGATSALGVVKVISLTNVCLIEPCGANSVDQIVTQTAVPEPASMLLLGTGLAGLAMRRRRRAQQQIQL